MNKLSKISEVFGISGVLHEGCGTVYYSLLGYSQVMYALTDDKLYLCNEVHFKKEREHMLTIFDLSDIDYYQLNPKEEDKLQLTFVMNEDFVGDFHKSTGFGYVDDRVIVELLFTKGEIQRLTEQFTRHGIHQRAGYIKTEAEAMYDEKLLKATGAKLVQWNRWYWTALATSFLISVISLMLFAHYQEQYSANSYFDLPFTLKLIFGGLFFLIIGVISFGGYAFYNTAYRFNPLYKGRGLADFIITIILIQGIILVIRYFFR